MKRLLVAVVVLSLSLPGWASALVYSPTLSDLTTWTEVGASKPANTFDSETFDNAVKFSGRIYGQTLPEPSFGYEWIGKNFNTPLNLSGYTAYALHIYNINESVWNYSLTLQDMYGFDIVNPAGTPIVNGTDAILSADLTAFADLGMDLTNIVSIGLFISQKVPIPAQPVADRQYETAVAPVPEPGTMILLGCGFLGLAIYGKRRRNA